MKKLILISTSLLLCLSFAACGSANEAETTASSHGFDLNLDIPTISIDAIEPVTNNGMDIDLNFDIPKIEIDPITVAPRDENFFKDLLSGWDVKLDIESFNSEFFVADSKDNFSLEDQSIIKKMDKEQLIEIAEAKANLLHDLADAFEQSGLSVQIDETTGTIDLDSSVLFDTDSYAISESGKKLLKEFIQVYTQVVFHEKYDGFVSKIIIEGHTDTSGDYDHNKTLSQQRADAVMQYLVSAESGISQEYCDALMHTVSAEGYSWDKPIYDADGNVDMDASRRVSFRFLISLPE